MEEQEKIQEQEVVEVQEPQEQEEVQEQEQVQEHQEAPESEPEINVSAQNANHIRELREKNKRLEKNLRESYGFIEQLQKKASKPKIEEPEIAEDDFVDGRNWKKIRQDMKDMKKELEKTRQQSTAARLQLEFPDIAKVLSNENIERLEDQEPEVAKMIVALGDRYSQHKMTYKMIKQFGIFKEEFPLRKEKISKNIKKPIPSTSIVREDSPIKKIHSYGMTEEEKAEYRRLNKEAMR